MSQIVINFAIVSFFLIEMECVTDFMSRFLEKRPIVYSDLIWEHDNKYSVPFKPDLKNMKLIKKIKLMNKYHYFMFYLLREI